MEFMNIMGGSTSSATRPHRPPLAGRARRTPAVPRASHPFNRIASSVGFACLFLLATTAATHAQAILYVNDDATGGIDGSSWADAFTDLQDALGVAKLASKSHMAGILYKTIVGRKNSAATVAGIKSNLDSWCAEKGYTPVHLWAGASVTQGFMSKIEPAWSENNLKSGVKGLWMPNNTSANTLNIVGGKPSDATRPLG